MTKIYISHPIQGKHGKNATDEEMKTNCQQAIEFGKVLRKRYPNVEFYIPAEYEDFVNRAYRLKFLSIRDILCVDCEIVKTCDAVLALAIDGILSNGMIEEISTAQSFNIPVRVIIQANGKYHNFYIADNLLNSLGSK